MGSSPGQSITFLGTINRVHYELILLSSLLVLRTGYWPREMDRMTSESLVTSKYIKPRPPGWGGRQPSNIIFADRICSKMAITVKSNLAVSHRASFGLLLHRELIFPHQAPTTVGNQYMEIVRK